MKRLGVVLLVLIISGSVSAQSNCGNGLPCGPIPWPLPLYPPLASPTPASELVDPGASTDPSNTPTPSFTWTPSATMTFTPEPTATATQLPTATPFFEVDVIEDIIATLDAFSASPAQVVQHADGTPMFNEDMEAVNTSAQTFFNYARGLNSTIFGPFTPLVGIILFGFVLSWFMGAMKFSLPLIAVVIGVVRRIIEFIINIIRTLLGFIPFFG